MNTTGGGVTGISGAGIQVVAVEVAVGDAFSEVAVITGCTHVLVGAGNLIEGVNAADDRVARICGADISVRTDEQTSICAFPV
jgi:predicted ThiF/HesA family dinucleotide-utilizing enzyme